MPREVGTLLVMLRFASKLNAAVEVAASSVGCGFSCEDACNLVKKLIASKRSFSICD